MTKTTALILLLALTACNDRFVADFEGDTPGAPPALSPPGPPDDEIVISSSDADGDGIVIEVTDEPQLVATGQPHRFMSLIRELNPGQTSVALLRSAPMATGTRSIFLRWDQILDGGGSGTIIVFPLPDETNEDTQICVVITGNDVITLDCPGADGPGFEQVDGIDTQSLHSIVMRLDRSPRRAALQAFQNGTATATVTLTGNELPAPIEGQRLSAQIEYDGQSDGAYRFNSFFVEEVDPN